MTGRAEWRLLNGDGFGNGGIGAGLLCSIYFASWLAVRTCCFFLKFACIRFDHFFR